MPDPVSREWFALNDSRCLSRKNIPRIKGGCAVMVSTKFRGNRNTISHGQWNNGKEVPRWGVADIQKMSPSTTDVIVVSNSPPIVVVYWMSVLVNIFN